MSRDSRFDRTLAALPQLSLVALTVALCIQQIRSYDYWWHLRTGRMILETHAVPVADPFSYTAPGSTWIDVHWLFQIALSSVYQLGGHVGVTLALLAMVLLLVGIVRHTAMLLAAVLALFDRFERRGDAWIYAIVPIQLVWANFHGLFAVGLAVCGIFFAAELLRPFSPSGGPLRAARVRRLAAVTALSSLTCLINPQAVELPLYALKQLGMIGADRHPGLASFEISSLISAWPTYNTLYRAAILALAFASFAAIIANWRRTRLADALLWLTFLVLAVAAQRNTALFAVVATPILIRNTAECLHRAQPRPRLQMLAAVLVSALMLGMAVDAQRGHFFARLGVAPREPGFGVVEVMLPVGSVDWIESKSPPGPIAHHMADGGYLIWRLYPTYRVMIDGRLEVFGGEKNMRLRITNADVFRELDRTYHFGTAIVHLNDFYQGDLLEALYANPGWKLVSVDDAAAVFVRTESAAPYPEVDVSKANLFPPLPAAHTSVRAYRIDARVRFYTAVGRRDLAQRVLREQAQR